MNITITPSRLHGAITPPPSKSRAHRLLIAAALAGGESVISNLSFSQDIEATWRCLQAMGARGERTGDTLTVTGLGDAIPRRRNGRLPHFDCGESGSTLRFLIPVALAVCGGGVFTGRGRLMERPQGPYEALFREKGIFWEQKEGVLTVRGVLTPGEYRLPGDVSSQFFTGLLYALPLLPGPSAIVPTTHLESEGYIAMTLQTLEQFGIQIPTAYTLPPKYFIRGGESYRPARAAVEGDWSNAGFWYAAGAMGNQVDILRMNADSLQGDRIVQEWAGRIGDRPGGTLSLDVSATPDLVPALAAMGSVMEGTLLLKNAARLRIKESDRLSTVREELCKLGAQVTEGEDSLTIRGVEGLHGGRVQSHNDHRIAMMLAIAATRADGPVILEGAQAVDKSYPTFWKDYVNLGGQISPEPEP